jgi:hypothetical protein
VLGAAVRGAAFRRLALYGPQHGKRSARTGSRARAAWQPAGRPGERCSAS